MTWTSLSFAYGSVLTSTKMTQLQDNITALAHGDSGAPAVLSKALGAVAVGSACVLGLITVPSSGGILSAGVSSSNIVGYQEVYNMRVNQEGSYRLRYWFESHGTNSYAQVARNGTAINSHVLGNALSSMYLDDVASCMVGDTLQIFGAPYDGTTNFALTQGAVSITNPSSGCFIPPSILQLGDR